jgi:autotransporter-associated beta strand protein
MKTFLAVCVGMLLFMSPASAVIITTGTSDGSYDSSLGIGSVAYSLQGGGNTVVFGTYIDNTYTASNVQLGGVAADGFVQDGRALLAYFFNPVASGNITFDTTGGSTNSAYFIYELSGVDISAGVDLGIGDAITTTVDNRFVVNFIGANNTDGATLLPAPTSVATFTGVGNANGALGGGSIGAASAAEVVVGTAGVKTLGWQGFGGGFGQGQVSAAFSALPGGPVAWNFDGGGNWSLGANWTGGSSPASGGELLFGSVLTAANAPASVSLDIPVNVSKITFSNPSRYNVTGPQALTLSGAAELAVGSGTHGISAVIAGNSGLVKSGGGTLVLSANNTYTGLTQVTGGTLQLANAGAVDGAIDVAANAQLAFVAGYNGTLAGSISGGGSMLLDSSLTSEVVTLNQATSLGGTININGGTLAISHPSALGTGDGTPATQTRINDFGGTGTGRLALSGNITVANELLILGPRRGEGVADLVHLTSSGNNTWAGNIKGDANGDNYNFESTAGTLTLSGTLSAPDGGDGIRNFVFSGDGNFDVTRITDFETNANGVQDVASLNTQTNVFVYKRGAGTLTVRTATSQQNDFWQGGTFIEQGTLEVISNGSNAGELWGPIEIRSGATLDVDHFGTYALAPAQSLSGGGLVLATGRIVKVFADNSLSPGDNGVGTLTINGNMQLSDEFGTQGGTLSFDLGNDPSIVGMGENDLIRVNGSLSTIGSPDMTVSVTAADGSLSAGQYRLIAHTGGTVDVSGLTPAFLDALGNPLTTRQTLGVTAAPGQVNLVVTGSAANLVWTGVNGTAWDKNLTQNWTDGGPEVFFDQDQVLFDDTAGENDTVDISGEDVYPSIATFNSTTGNTYNITGTHGFGGQTPINLTGDVTLSLANTNNLGGNVNVGADATLQFAGGGQTVSGNISGAGTVVFQTGADLQSANSFTGEAIINGGTVNIGNANSLGTTDAGTTINGGVLQFLFTNLSVNESLTFNGGSMIVAGNDASAVTLTGGVEIAAGGGTMLVNGGIGADALVIAGNITGNASGQLTANVGPGSTMSVAGNIANNGRLLKTGTGTLAIGASTTVNALEIDIQGGTFDVSAQSALALASGQTLTGNFGTVAGNVTAASGSTLRVGDDGLVAGIVYNYTDATWGEGGNTVIAADGSVLTPLANIFGAQTQWNARTPFGNGGFVLQGQLGDLADQAPELKTVVGGLNPGEQYDVLVHFWNDGSGWQIQAGDALGNLALYTPGNSPLASTFDYSSLVLTTEGNRTMYAAQLSLTANASGEIELFLDEASSANGPRTWYDGLSIAQQTVVGETFTIDGDLTLQTGSTLALDIGLPTASDRLVVTGALSAGGTLAVSLAEGVAAPVLGDVFDVLDFATASGGFASDTSSLLVDGTLAVIEFAGLLGDFNGDGVVDAADYPVWRDNLGASESVLPQGSFVPGNGTIDAEEYNLWRSQFGTTAASLNSAGGLASVPEPNSTILALAAMAVVVGYRARRLVGSIASTES